MIMSRRLRWAGHIECMGERRGADTVLVGKHEIRRSFGPGVDEKIILKWILRSGRGGMD
jgi:hypothetical protein